jgi:D-xylose 1-dehydrogenase (NADP+, D-xylono-1,5-lactone-forming)
MEPVRWGILSTASINSAVIPPLQASPDGEVVAIASREQARADASAAEWGIPRAYGTYDALLDDPEVEAVYISLPASLHVEWSIRALEAGKHVLCEKPFTRDPAAAARAFDAADAAGLLLMEAFMYRHHPQTQRLAALLAAGAVGKVGLIRATFCVPLPAGVVQMSPELDGGSLLDVGCYCISGSRLAGGEPTSVTAHQVVGPSGVDVRFAGTLLFPGEVVAQIDCAFDLPLQQSLEIVGDEGSLRVASPWSCERPAIAVRRGSETERIEIEDADRYRLQSDNFSRAVRGLEEPLLGRADALGQARTMEALYRSARQNGEPAVLAAFGA